MIAGTISAWPTKPQSNFAALRASRLDLAEGPGNQGDEIRSSDLAPSAPQLTPAIDVMLEVVTSPARRFETASELTEQKTTLLPLSATTRKLDRKTIKSGSLEAAIDNAVKKGVQGCENFVGVIVKRTTLDTNWSLGGVRFGRVDRGKANKAISLIIERMQREYKLLDD
jgi:hypothetical protein